MKQVIVTADDFGLSPEVNQAVIQAHQEGILTCASLMIAAPAVDEAVALAKAHPSLKVGLHLVLLEGFAVLSKDEIPDLVDESGRFSSGIVSSGIRYFFLKRTRSQIAKECEAQIGKFLTTGLKLDHLNSHHHMHIHPGILDIVIPLVRKYRIPAVRLPWQGFRTVRWKHFMTAVVMLPWVIRLRRKLRENGIACNREVFGLHETGCMVERTWLRLIPKLKPGVTEIYCHPAAENTSDVRQTPSSDHRVEEFAALLSPGVKARLGHEGAVLTCFGDLV